METEAKRQILTDIPQSSSLVEMIETTLLTSPNVIKNRNGVKVSVLEVSPAIILKANNLSLFFNNELPENIELGSEARVTFVDGLNRKSIKVSVFVKEGEKPRVDSWKVVSDGVTDPEIIHSRGLVSEPPRPYNGEFDETLEAIIEKAHTIDVDLLEYATMLDEFTKNENWSEDDTREGQNALMTAELHHRIWNEESRQMEPQRRQSGERYISHPWGAMEELIKAGMTNPDVLKATLLHDVPEDSPRLKQPTVNSKTGEFPLNTYSEWFQETLDLLTYNVGPVAAMYAMLLARPHPDGRTILSDSDAEDRYRMNLGLYPVVLLIKMADRLHNIKTLGSMPPEKQKKTILSTIEHYFPTFELARERYPEEVDYLMHELIVAIRPIALKNGIDVDML